MRVVAKVAVKSVEGNMGFRYTVGTVRSIDRHLGQLARLLQKAYADPNASAKTLVLIQKLRDECDILLDARLELRTKRISDG